MRSGSLEVFYMLNYQVPQETEKEDEDHRKDVYLCCFPFPEGRIIEKSRKRCTWCA
jgi:hypothetical protein